MAEQGRTVKVWVGQSRSGKPWLWLVGLLASIIVLGFGLSQVAIAQFSAAQTAILQAQSTVPAAPPPKLPPDALPELSALSFASTDPSLPILPGPGFGHRPYQEANAADLIVVASYSQAEDERFERLHQTAGLALLRMMDAARWDGIWLVAVSGFRDVERQEFLFQRQVSWRGSEHEAARSVAPPGFSEHHTGYAIDLTDGLSQTGDISLNFRDTAAFRWLTRHAHKFGFELSFPPDNPQGVTFEPWHWRFVGSPEAASTFAAARGQEEYE